MSVINTVVDFLLKKNWVIIILSFLITLVMHIIIPDSFFDNFYQKLPFDNTINTILVFIAICLFCFLILLGLKQIISYIYKKAKSNNNTLIQAFSTKDDDDYIHEFKSMADKWSDYDYSVVMHLINTNNQEPFTTGYIVGNSILNNQNYFHSTIESKPINLYSQGGSVPVGMISGSVTKFLMTNSFYEACKYVIERTGSLSHFDREVIDL